MGSQVSGWILSLDMSVSDSSISTHHNVFERHHRFIGWLGLAVCRPSPDRRTGTDKPSGYLDLCDFGKHLRHHSWPMESRR